MSHTAHIESTEHSNHEHGKQSFISKYIFSMDHKMISRQYLITGMIMGCIGGFMSLLFRLQLAWPGHHFTIIEMLLGKWGKGGVIDPNFFLALVTIHGTIMVFFVLTGGLSGTYSNLLIPLQIGARDMASPFMNMLGVWFFIASAVVLVCSFFLETGPASGGWTVYPPLSALDKAMPGSGTGMTLWLFSIVLFIISSLLGGINYISNVLNMRTKGMSMNRMPLTVWSFFFAAVVGLLSFPVLLGAGLFLIFDRMLGTSFYLSDIYLNGVGALDNVGGSPILYQHLFWFLGHPEVYIIILPAFGIVSEIISNNARKPIFGYTAMIISMFSISFLSFLVWGHHMFVTGMNPFLGTVFMAISLIIAVPSSVKTFNYLTTLWKGNIRFTPGMLFSIGMVSLFISGGVTGMFLGNAAVDITLHDTYFVIGHFHLVMGAAAIFAMFGGVYHWFPKMFGRMMNNTLGHFHFWLTFIGAYVVFYPMHFLGAAGVPRRYYEFTLIPEFGVWVDVNIVMTLGAILGVSAQILFIYNFVKSIYWGEKATQNPWNANGLEWTTPVEHIHGNWPGPLPVVYRGAYEYSVPGRELDYWPQNEPGDDDMVEIKHEPVSPESPEVDTVESDNINTDTSKVFFSSFARLLGLVKV
ncbi:MAG: cbb3-type cytochrome c oxidase subunit I [Bacteroidetes bacterium]|nr:cbb3-type cytochrome c oxidase subunit I [Bacteroidota bacterium]